MTNVTTVLPTHSFSGTFFQAPLVTARRAPCTVRAIQCEVARYYAIPLLEMTSQRRNREVARARQVGMYLCRQLTVLSLPTIGRLFGGRDHSTVMHACKVIEDLVFDDDMLAQDVAYLKARLA